MVEALQRGEVIGWYHGPFEWGPRALGGRSILADPRRDDMKDIVNIKIKFREPFRPLAPSVLAEKAHRLIEKFGEATGVPLLLNTSFNLKGEPIVSSPADALSTFRKSGMDVLVLENCVVRKT